MNILLIAGHGAGDTGACGCGYQEYKLTRELVDLIMARLGKHANVDVYNKNRSAFYDCQNGTFKIGTYDYVLEVHFNACVNDQNGDGRTTGTEIYVTSSENGTTVEQGIVNKVAACGLKNRGVKVMDFLVIRTIKNKGISSALIETCFIDDKDDMDVYQSKKASIADGIVNGIVEGFGLKDAPKPAEKKRHEDPNGIIYVGDTVCFNAIFTADELDIRNNRVCCHKLIGGKPSQSYHWVDSNPCIEVNANGQKAGDQVFYVGDKFKIPGDYKVRALDLATDACKVKIGNHETWVKSAYLSKVTYK